MRTFLMIKPDGVRRGLVGEIISRFERYGFRISAMKMLNLTREKAEQLYSVHKEKPFFRDLIEYVTSGPIVAIALEHEAMDGETMIKLVRKIVGKTNPLEAEMGSIRGDYAYDISQNLVHASDSIDSARRELNVFFSDEDFTNY